MRAYLFFACFFIYFFSDAQITISNIKINLGETPVSIIEQYNARKNNIFLIHVHSNEQTALKVMQQFAGDSLSTVQLFHGSARHISFKFQRTNFIFDPNRIFTEHGIRKTLKPSSSSSGQIVKAFADNILKQLKPASFIIALHNNTNKEFSVKSYLPGNIYGKEAADVYINTTLDADDFIFTTDRNIFNSCKKEKFNAVLQDNARCTDDGSLSVYYSHTKISYTNIEAEDGHFQQQLRMIQVVYKIIRQ